MPNPIQRMLHQASESVPGQRPIRLPWQEPTLGERAAGTLEALADTSVEAEDRLARLNERTTSRAQEAKRAGGETLAGARGRARRNLETAQMTAQEQASRLSAQASEQVGDLAESARGRARRWGRRAAMRGAAAAESAARTQRKLGEQVNAVSQRGADMLASTGGSLRPTGGADAADAADAADRAARSADRAESASRSAVGAATQMADALNRILQGRGEMRAVVAEETPSDVEIRVGEAAQSPLMRAADAVARVLAAAGGTIYDYSGGHYGLEPVDAGELRRERKREKRTARPVTIIEGHYTGEKAARQERKGARTFLLLGGLAVGGAAIGIAYTQRGRLRPLLVQAVAQVQSRRSGTSQRPVKRITTGPSTPTPAFDRVVSGQLIETASPPTAATSQPPLAASSDGTERTYVAGEQAQTPLQP